MNLCELINTIKERDGLTWRELVERARRKGAHPPTGLYYMADPDRPMQDFPRTKTIVGVAAALDVEPRVVAAAALESLGLNGPDVELHVRAVQVYSGDKSSELDDQSGDRWIVVTPHESTSDEQITQAVTSRKLLLRIHEQS